MPTQKEHWQGVFEHFNELCALVECVRDVLHKAQYTQQYDAIQKELYALFENLQGVNLRLLNDEHKERVVEGLDQAIGALTLKHAPSTLHNRDAALSPDGVQIPPITITMLFEAITFYEADMKEKQPVPLLFLQCLGMLIKMFVNATPEENAMLRALAHRSLNE